MVLNIRSSMFKKILLFLALFMFVTGCAGVSVSKKRADINLRLLGTESNPLKDPDVSRKSALLHHYILGQLALNDEDPKDALMHFAAVNELSTSSPLLVSSQLTALYLRNGDVSKAYEMSSRIVRNHPEVPNLLLHAGILEALNRLDEAADVYLRIIREKAGFSKAYVYLTSIYFNQSKYDDAIKLLKKLVKLKPKEISGYYYLAKAYELKDDLQKAGQYIKQAFITSKKQEKLGLDYIRLLIKQNRLKTAKAVCKKLVDSHSGYFLSNQIYPLFEGKEPDREAILKKLQFLEKVEMDPTSVRLKIALVEIERNQLESAAMDLLLVLARRPSDSRSRYYMGSVYAASGHKKAAIDELMKIKPGQEMMIESRTFASYLYRQMDDLTGAEQAVREALEVKPDDPNLIFQLVDILRASEKYRSAEDMVLRALEGRPQDERLLFAYGIIAHELGKTSKAQSIMEKIITINPNHSQALNYVAYTMAEEGKDLDKAMEMVNKALMLQPEDGYFMDTLGWIYFQRGKYREANKVLKKAVNLTGTDVVIMEHYAESLEKLGEAAKAFSYYTLALEQAKESKDREELEAKSRIKSRIRELLSRYPHLKPSGR